MSHTRFGFQARNTPAERRAFFDLIRNDHRTSREMEAVLDTIEALPRGIVHRMAGVGNISITGGTQAALCATADVTFEDGRLYRAVCYVRAIDSAGSSLSVSIRNAGVELTGTYGGHGHAASGSPYTSVYAEFIIVGTGQNHPTLSFYGHTAATCNWFASPNSAFYVEDMGLA